MKRHRYVEEPKKKFEKIRAFRKLKTKQGLKEKPITWGVQCDSLSGKLTYIAYATNDDSGVYGSIFISDFIDLMLDHLYPEVWYAHNAQYAWMPLLDELVNIRKMHVEFIQSSKTNIVSIVVWHQTPTGIDGIDKGIPKTVLRDSLALIPDSVQKIAKTSSITVDTRNAALLVSVTKELRKELVQLNSDFIDAFGCSMGFSVTDSALKAWQTTIESEYPFYCSSPTVEQHIENRFNGKLRGAFQYIKEVSQHSSCTTYTIHFTERAYGQDFMLPSYKATGVRRVYTGEIGLYEVILEPPHSLSLLDDNILRLYTETNHIDEYQRRQCAIRERVVVNNNGTDFQTNDGSQKRQFKSNLTNIDLDFLMERGYTIKEIIDGTGFMGWPTLPFDHFTLKDYISTSSIFNKIDSLMRHAVMAALSQKRYIGYYYRSPAYNSELEYANFLRSMGEWESTFIHPNRPGYLTDERLFIPHNNMVFDQYVERHDYSGTWLLAVLNKSIRRLPHWSAFTESYIRVQKLKLVQDIGEEHVIYCDNDLITITDTVDPEIIAKYTNGLECVVLKPFEEWNLFSVNGIKDYTCESKNGCTVVRKPYSLIREQRDIR